MSTIRLRDHIGHAIDGGHNFPVRPDLVMKADTIPELVAKIADYRIQNGLPPGDPIGEVTDYYAIHYPFAIENGDRKDRPVDDKLKHNVYSWVNAMWKTPPKEHLELEDAGARVEKCLKCPFRRDVIQDLSPEGNEIRRRTYLLSKGLLWDNSAGVCEDYEWDNRLAVLIHHEDKARIGALKFCWMCNDSA